jgi:outer membrane protein TolC
VAAGFACLLIWVAQATAGSPQKPESYGYFDFPTCLRYALVHSEAFLRNRLEIQVKSADVKDAHAELLPTIQLVTRYYFARTDSTGGNRVNVSLTMADWNPLLALLKIKASGILVDIARETHYDKIAQNTGDMAKLFLRVYALEKLLRARKQIVALQQDKVDYGKSRDQQGSMDQIELRTWDNQLRGERLKIADAEQELQEKLLQLKVLMGYYPDTYLPLDTRDALNQVLNGFNGRAVTFGDVQARNYALKIIAKNEQLQSNFVTGAYVSLLPRPVMVFESIDNQVDRTSGFNFALGLDYTVWDGFRRVRDIKRQKMKGEQLKLDRDLLAKKVYGSFVQLRGLLNSSGEKEAFEREQAKLAEMSEEKAFTYYKAGSIPYEEYVQRRIEKVEANINTLTSLQERVTALIELATIAGGLDKYNARLRY